MSPSDAGDRWDEAKVEDLAKVDPKDPSDADIEAAKSKARQTYAFRRALFKTILISLSGSLLAAAAFTGVYMLSEWGDIDPVVLVSFNAAVVVNTIGLAYVVARYLFPEGGADD